MNPILILLVFAACFVFAAFAVRDIRYGVASGKLPLWLSTRLAWIVPLAVFLAGPIVAAVLLFVRWWTGGW